MSACTGPLAERFPDDVEWAHTLFACDPSCPLEAAHTRHPHDTPIGGQ